MERFAIVHNFKKRFVVSSEIAGKAIGWINEMSGTFNAKSLGRNRRGSVMVVGGAGTRTDSGEWEIVIEFRPGKSAFWRYGNKCFQLYKFVDWSKFLRKLSMANLSL
jgi:hypothetical protein